MARRRSRRLPFIDDVMVVAIAAGGIWLILAHLVGTAPSTAGYAATAVGAFLVGLFARPWADRALRRFGVRLVRVRGRS